MDDPQKFRYEQVKEFSVKLKILADRFHKQIVSLRRKIALVDTMSYFLVACMSTVSIIITTVSTLSPAIVISVATTASAVSTKLSKKLLSCLHVQLDNSIVHHKTATEAYSEMISMISSSVGNSEISAEEFTDIDKLYDRTMVALESEQSAPATESPAES